MLLQDVQQHNEYIFWYEEMAVTCNVVVTSGPGSPESRVSQRGLEERVEYK